MKSGNFKTGYAVYGDNRRQPIIRLLRFPPSRPIYRATLPGLAMKTATFQIGVQYENPERLNAN